MSEEERPTVVSGYGSSLCHFCPVTRSGKVGASSLGVEVPSEASSLFLLGLDGSLGGSQLSVPLLPV